MKRCTLFLLVLMYSASGLLAQDVIITRESKRIDGKVLEISDTEIRYKKQNNPDGPVFVIKNEKVSSILFANGEVQSFKSEQTPLPDNEHKETSVVPTVPFDPLFRDEGQLVSRKSYPYEPENLREMLGRDAYDSYLSAQSQYSRGSTCVTFGWLDFIFSIPLYIVGFSGFTNETISEYAATWIITAASLLDISSAVLLPVGYTVKGIAAGRISRIAEHYNAGQTRHLSMELGIAPTLLPLADGTIAPGVGLSLRF